MKKQITRITVLLALVMTLSACGTRPMNSGESTEPMKDQSVSMQPENKDDMMAEYKKISADEAKNMMSEDVIILDVRTTAEFEEAHIPGAILIPNTDIASKAEMTLSDKARTILVYCRSGNRSETAAKELIAMGYTSVYDFGGINNWTGETVSGKSDSMMDPAKKEQ